MLFPLHLQSFVVNNQSVSLYVPEQAAAKAAYNNGAIAFPYWSKVWPAAIALSEFITRHAHLLQNKKVLEIGAGLGLPSIVAARYAASVLCTDGAVEAVATAQQSADHHHLQNFSTAVLDWQCLPDDVQADVLLLSDVNYEPSAFALLLNMIEHFLQAGTLIIISTPQRLMAKPFIEQLLRYSTMHEQTEVTQNGETVTLTIQLLQRHCEEKT